MAQKDFEHFRTNAKLIKGHEHIPDLILHGPSVAFFNCFFTLSHCGLNDVPGDHLKDACPDPALSVIGDVLVFVAFSLNGVPSALGVSPVPDLELTGDLGVGLQIPGKGLDL